MADETKPTGSDDSQKGAADADSTTTQDTTTEEELDFKAEYLRIKAQNEDIVRSRNKEKARRKEIEDRLAELELERRAEEEGKHVKDGDVDRLKESFRRERDDFTKKLAQKDLALNKYVKRGEIVKLAIELNAHDPEVVCDLLEDKVSVSFNEKGHATFDVDGDYNTVKDFIKNFLDQKPYLKKSSFTGGAGDTGGADKKSTKAGTIPANISSWPIAEQKKWMKENPELARTLVNNMMGGSG